MPGKGSAKNGSDASSSNLTVADDDLTRVEENVKKHGELIASLDIRFADQQKCFDDLKKRSDMHTNRFDEHSHRLDSIEASLAKMLLAIEELNLKQSSQFSSSRTTETTEGDLHNSFLISEGPTKVKLRHNSQSKNAKLSKESEDLTTGGIECPEDNPSTIGSPEGIDLPLLKGKVKRTTNLVSIRELILTSPKTFDQVALAKAKKESNAIQSQLTDVWKILSTSTDPSKLLHTWYNFREFVSTSFEAGIHFMDAAMVLCLFRRLSTASAVKEDLKPFSSEYEQRNPNLVAIEWGLAFQCSKNPKGTSVLIDDLRTPSSFDWLSDLLTLLRSPQFSAEQKRFCPQTAEDVDHTIQLLTALVHEQDISTATGGQREILKVCDHHVIFQCGDFRKLTTLLAFYGLPEDERKTLEHQFNHLFAPALQIADTVSSSNTLYTCAERLVNLSPFLPTMKDLVRKAFKSLTDPLVTWALFCRIVSWDLTIYQLDHPLEGTKGFVISFLEELAKFQKHSSVPSIMTLSQEAAKSANNIHTTKIDFKQFLSHLSDILSSTASNEFRRVAKAISCAEPIPPSAAFVASPSEVTYESTPSFVGIRGDRDVQSFREQFVDRLKNFNKMTPSSPRVTDAQRDALKTQWSSAPLGNDASPRHPSRKDRQQKKEQHKHNIAGDEPNTKILSRSDSPRVKHHSPGRGVPGGRRYSGTSESDTSGAEEGNYFSDGQQNPAVVPMPKGNRNISKSALNHDPQSFYNAYGFPSQSFCPDPRQYFGYCPYPMFFPDPRFYIGPNFYNKGMTSTPPQQPNITALKKQYAYFASPEDGELHPWSEMDDDTTRVYFCGFNAKGYPVLSYHAAPLDHSVGPPSLPAPAPVLHSGDSTSKVTFQLDPLAPPVSDTKALTAFPKQSGALVGPDIRSPVQPNPRTTAFQAHPLLFDLDTCMSGDPLFR